jgi:hypothetical protein
MAKPGPVLDAKWPGHLVARAEGFMGDFTIQQAERKERGLVTGPAVVCEFPDAKFKWLLADEATGTTIEYWKLEDETYRRSPDWTNWKRRSPVVGKLIRAVRDRAEISRAV